MKRVGQLWDLLVSDENLSEAIDEVNRTHHWHRKHRVNRCTVWVETTKKERIKELREILEQGFVQAKPRHIQRYDASAQKWRDIHEPRQWPDQYVHHALIQAIQPALMQGMDPYCCGSIRGRGASRCRKAIRKWMRSDKKGTKYCLQADIYHFYDSLTPQVVMYRMRRLIKDKRVLDLIEATVKDGIYIGAYTSQWYANALLQPLDRLFRQEKLGVKHYARYMDNLTIFGANKRLLRHAVDRASEWLIKFGLRLKGDWQVFPTAKRLPSAGGFRYGRDYVIPRKRNLLRLKRATARYRKNVREKRFVSAHTAAGLLSRFGQLAWCNNVNLYQRLNRGERVQRALKNIVRQYYRRKGFLTWNMFLEQKATPKSSRSKAPPVPT